LCILVDEVKLLLAKLGSIQEIRKGCHHTTQLRHGKGLVDFVDKVTLELGVSTSAIRQESLSKC
jgi:hypothetical protein